MAIASQSFQKLIQIPFCKGLSDSEAHVVSEISDEEQAPKGQVLFREGDPGEAMYAILEGRVDVTKKDPTGTQQLLATLTEGSVLGEMCLLGAVPHRSASATAHTDVRLLKIPAGRFAELLKRDDMAALKIVRNLALVMSRRLQAMNEKVVHVIEKGKKKEEMQDFHKLLSDWSF